MCQNTTMRLYGAWIKSYCVLFSKTFSTLGSLLWFPVGSRQAARGAPIGETRFMTPGIFRQTNSNGQVGFWPGDSYGTKRMTEKDINSSNAGDGIIRLWRSIPCLLMHWLLKLPVHQLAWHWLCRADNLYRCSSVNFIDLSQTNSRMRFKMWIYLL